MLVTIVRPHTSAGLALTFLFDPEENGHGLWTPTTLFGILQTDPVHNPEIKTVKKGQNREAKSKRCHQTVLRPSVRPLGHRSTKKISSFINLHQIVRQIGIRPSEPV